MPVIQRFFACVIYINPREHNPPHFHVRTNDGREALVDIATLELVSSGVARRVIVEAISWAATNLELLMAKFKEYNP